MLKKKIDDFIYEECSRMRVVINVTTALLTYSEI